MRNKDVPINQKRDSITPKFTKQVNWLTVIVSLGLGVIAILTTNTNPRLQILLGIVVLFMVLLRALKRMLGKSEKKQKIRRNKFENHLFYVAAFFLTSEMRESALGDLEERHYKMVKRFGKRRANTLLLYDTLRSIIPQLYDVTRRIAIKFMKFIGIYEIYRRLLG